jgi:ATP-dependent protease HslVU (ClpYQ) ATPase subunit
LDKVLATETSATEAQAKAQEMEEQKNNLEEKLRNSNLSVADLKVAGVFKKGSADEETFKANKTKKLKITFTILQNELVEPGNKDIVIRIIGTSNEVLTNDNEKLMDTDKLSTMTEPIYFQNDLIKTTIFYTQKASYKKGTYSIELLHRDKLMGRAAFILK